MTLILELPAEIEARINADARARGVAPEIIVIEKVSALYHEDDANEKRRRAALSGLGMFAGYGRSVDEFLAERHAEGEAEYDGWLESRAGTENFAEDLS